VHIAVWSLDILNGCKQFVKIGESKFCTTTVRAATAQDTVSGRNDFKLTVIIFCVLLYTKKQPLKFMHDFFTDQL